MQFSEVVQNRFSCRDFDSQAYIERSTVNKIIESGLRAPSAGNVQPWHIFVIVSPDVKRDLVRVAYGQNFIAAAPVVLAVCADMHKSSQVYGSRGRDLYCIQDTAALIENILLAVVDEGLGGCWVGAFDEAGCARLLHCSRNERPVALVPVGVPAGRVHRTGRRSADEVVTWVE